MTEQMEQMIYNEGRRRGREEATKELMEWHNRVCEEMAKRHTAERHMILGDGTLVVNVSDATAVTRVLVEDEKKNGSLYYADRPKGEWINKHEWDNGFLERECSLCGAMKPILMHTAKINFCPQCGADMRGADDAQQ